MAGVQQWRHVKMQGSAAVVEKYIYMIFVGEYKKLNFLLQGI